MVEVTNGDILLLVKDQAVLILWVQTDLNHSPNDLEAYSWRMTKLQFQKYAIGGRK